MFDRNLGAAHARHSFDGWPGAAATFSLLVAIATCLSGCAATKQQPQSLAAMVKQSTQVEYRDCLRTLERKAWWAHWDERYMRPDMEQFCSAQVGRKYTMPKYRAYWHPLM